MDGYYDDGTTDCKICNTSCLTCVNTATYCLTCYLAFDIRQNNTPICSCRGDRYGEFCVCEIGKYHDIRFD